MDGNEEGDSMIDILQIYGPHRDELSSAVLADVLDGLGSLHSAVPADIRPLRKEWRIFGRAATLSTMTVAEEPKRPYAIELECVDSLRPGDVLVATTNGDRSSALWGELLSTASRARGAVGVVVDGLTRDAGKILAMDFPVFASGFSPLDSKGRLDGVRHGEPIKLGPCLVRPGDFVFGDIDGIVVVPATLAERAFALAMEKVTGENKVRAELAKGRSAREVFAEYGIL
jgi:4-hydroxy-4-methyl-2-oxoglutarate aldolase